MCEIIEEYAKEKAAEAEKASAKKVSRESAKELFINNVNFDIIKKSFKELSESELLEIQREVQLEMHKQKAFL